MKVATYSNLALFLLALVVPVPGAFADSPPNGAAVEESSEEESSRESSADDESQREEIFDEIVVTGGLIEETLQDTPESVAVWGSDAITDAGMLELQDVLNQTANAYQLLNGEGFGIRGINHTGVGTGGVGELGSYYIDGVAVTGFAKRIGPTQLWDVAQVEILRGPQTTNVGLNALGGAIVLATKEPVFQYESRWRVGLAEDSSWEAAGMVNAPLSDTSALRITAETWNRDGYINNPTRGEDDFNARENNTLRAKYLYLPKSANNFSAQVTAQYGETRRGSDVIVLEFLDDRINDSNLEEFENNDSLSFSVDLRWSLNDRWSLRSISSLLQSDTSTFGDGDRAPTGSTFTARDRSDDNWAQDVRFEYAGPSSQGALGFYVTEVTAKGMSTAETELLSREVGIPPTLLPFYPVVNRVGVESPFDIETSNYALFGRWDWQLTDRWRAFAGLRWDVEQLDSDETIQTRLLSELPDTSLLPPPLAAAIEQVNALLLARLGTTSRRTETEYDALLPEAGISYEWSDAVTTSLFYKRGYRAGGAQVTVVGRFNEYDPETLDLVEFSLRSTALDKRLTFNTNVYYGDWTDQQITVAQTDQIFDFLVENAGASELYGVEIETAYRPRRAWNVYGSVGFAHTEFTEFETSQGEDVTGNRFASAPEWTASLGFNYRFADGWFVHADVGYQGEAFARIFNEPEFMLDERTLFNLRGGYETGSYSVLAFIDNATDEQYLVSKFPGVGNRGFGRLGDPRQAGVQLLLRF
ncbi:MAG: TonB-dependent receptor [Acidobacteriota bacterium]